MKQSWVGLSLIAVVAGIALLWYLSITTQGPGEQVQDNGPPLIENGRGADARTTELSALESGIERTRESADSEAIKTDRPRRIDRAVADVSAVEEDEILLLVEPETDDGIGEFQEITLRQIRDAIQMTQDDLALSAVDIMELEDKFLDAGGEIRDDGELHYAYGEQLPETLREFVDNLRQTLEREYHRELWRRDKLRRYRNALKESGYSENRGP